MSNAKLPSLSDIKEWMVVIARENGIPKQVANTWKHSRLNWLYTDAIAQVLIKNNVKVDRTLLRVACFVHDVGRMKTGSRGTQVLQHPIYHTYIGYRLVKQKGYSEKLARMCVVHMAGSGLDSKTNKQHGFKEKNYFPTTIEEKLLAYADARNSYNPKMGPCIDGFWKAYNRFKRYGGVARLQSIHHELKKLTNNKLEELVPKL